MTVARLVVRGSRVVTPGGVVSAAVHIDDGVITSLSDLEDIPYGYEVVDAGDLVVLPGLVDTHVHVNEPGRTEWEGFDTATRAAAAGGVTTLVDMPLNSIPPTTTVEALDEKRVAARGQCWVDVGFWAGIVPGNTGELEGLVAEGVFGFKAFLSDSGVPEFGRLDPGELDSPVRVLAGLGALTVVHAEAPGPLADAVQAAGARDPRTYAAWLASRPDRAEVEAVASVVGLAGRQAARAHILHLSSADALEPLRRGQADGVAVTAETCPHYLTLAAEYIPDGATAYKCAPPIRNAANRDRLWEALADGAIGMVVSDHSPSTPELKELDSGNFLEAWGGIASLQLGLPAVWSEARRRGHGVEDVARWMSAAPAELVGLSSKGAVAPGRDADLVLWDPDAPFVVDGRRLEHRHDVTPYEGQELHGIVRATYLRGELVYGDGRFGAHPRGRLLRKEAA